MRDEKGLRIEIEAANEDTLTVWVRDEQRCYLSIENPWAGDSETGFGQSTQIALDAAGAARLAAFLATWLKHLELVGGTGIEPVTPCMSSKCSTAELTARPEYETTFWWENGKLVKGVRLRSKDVASDSEKP